MRREIPGPLWIALVSLGLAPVSIGLMVIMTTGHAGPLILIDAALSGLLIWGLATAQKWAYVLTIVFAALGTVSALARSVVGGLSVLVLDCLVLVPVLVCTSWYFPVAKREKY